MPRFRKKPVEVEAYCMRQDSQMGDWPEWLQAAARLPVGVKGSMHLDGAGPDALFRIETLEGGHTVSWGDFIIQGVQDELYPCKPDIFTATYDADGSFQRAAAFAWRDPDSALRRLPESIRESLRGAAAGIPVASSVLIFASGAPVPPGAEVDIEALCWSGGSVFPARQVIAKPLGFIGLDGNEAQFGLVGLSVGGRQQLVGAGPVPFRVLATSPESLPVPAAMTGERIVMRVANLGDVAASFTALMDAKVIDEGSPGGTVEASGPR